MDINSCRSILFYVGLILFNRPAAIHGQVYLSKICTATFDNATFTLDASYPNASLFLCPSSCFTSRYATDHTEYPVFGNESYSGNSLVCKSALHDGRLAPWSGESSPVLISADSSQSSVFTSALRNGVLSSKSTGATFNSYRFVNKRINESSILDIAIEHRGFLYQQDQPSSITCRSRSDSVSIQPVEIDQGWKRWVEHPLRYFAFPWNMTRDQALNFCLSNNGTLFYWSNQMEEGLLREVLWATLHQLFRYQRSAAGNDTLTFFIGLKRINRIQQWESNFIRFNDSPVELNLNASVSDQDYCTVIQSSGANNPSFGIYPHRCDDQSQLGYPLCRLSPLFVDQQPAFVYRLESDSQPGNLTGVTDFCSELGGYPVFANNAYEWQLIQEVMLKDPKFNMDYAYTGLISETKQVTNAYWTPKNISYNSSSNYLWFTTPRGSDRIGYHLSKARDESFYGLYDINPYTVLNTLRFCRKNDVSREAKRESTCQGQTCRSTCLNVTMSSNTDDLRFGFYACYPKTSLASIVYTQSFPVDVDFIRPALPMDYSVSIRQNFNKSLVFTFAQSDTDLRSDCYEYLNMDRTSTLDDTVRLSCDSSQTTNKTINGIKMKKDFNGLLSIGLRERRISAHHARFIDYSDSGSRCYYQGVYHPYVEQCICAPGFYGSQCQYSCPPGYYGQECDYRCAGDDAYCQGLLICLADPYGCSCYTGWYGVNCNLSCPSDWYGPNCAYKCPCPSCNRFTGVCNCLGAECYQGIYSRSAIESRCSSSSVNLALLIAVPIASLLVLIGIIAGLFYWRKRRSSDEENLFDNSPVRFSSDSFQSPIDKSRFSRDYNNILSERL